MSKYSNNANTGIRGRAADDCMHKAIFDSARYACIGLKWSIATALAEVVQVVDKIEASV